jgi:hypothetical protein
MCAVWLYRFSDACDKYPKKERNILKREIITPPCGVQYFCWKMNFPKDLIFLDANPPKAKCLKAWKTSWKT